MVKIKEKAAAKVKIEKVFKYFYCTTIETQPALLAGSPDIQVEVSAGDVHIVYKGRLICGESREVIKNSVKKLHGVKEGDTFPKNAPFCPACKEGYKSNPESPWYKWERP